MEERNNADRNLNNALNHPPTYNIIFIKYINSVLKKINGYTLDCFMKTEIISIRSFQNLFKAGESKYKKREGKQKYKMSQERKKVMFSLKNNKLIITKFARNEVSRKYEGTYNSIIFTTHLHRKLN